jgi:hypothetical protein
MTCFVSSSYVRRGDDDTAPPLANVNEVLDSDKEAGDGDEDMMISPLYHSHLR